jgi:hypothetical protein
MTTYFPFNASIALRTKPAGAASLAKHQKTNFLNKKQKEKKYINY